MQNSKFNTILVGLGQMGKVWLSILKSNPDINVVALVDINTEAAKQAASAANIPENSVYSTLSDALEAKLNPQIVVDVTPPFIRAKIVIEALNNGLSVLSEKPMGINSSDVQNIFEAANLNKSLYMISQNYRWSSGALTIKKMLNEGKIGKVQEIYVNFGRNENFKDFRSNLDNPLLIDMAIHHFDLVRYFTDANGKKIICKEFNPQGSTFKQNAAAIAQVTMTGGEKFIYNGNWADYETSTNFSGNWIIKGDKGQIEWDGAYKITFLTDNSIEHKVLSKEKDDKLAVSLSYFLEAIKNKSEPITSYKDNINTINMVLGAIESSRIDKVVALNL